MCRSVVGVTLCWLGLIRDAKYARKYEYENSSLNTAAHAHLVPPFMAEGVDAMSVEAVRGKLALVHVPVDKHVDPVPALLPRGVMTLTGLGS